MKKIIVAVGSKRLPKLNAVWEALNVVGPTLDPDAQFEIVGEDVESGVPHTPLSRAETMAGAQRRAEALVARAREGKHDWSYFVGLEGGLEVMVRPPTGSKRDMEKTQRIESLAAAREPVAGQRLVFLQNWAYVSDGSRGAFGQSGSILIPEALAARVVDGGVELAKAIDEFSGGKGIRDAQGAWGVFTRNMITRQDAFRTAVINAFAPFFNSALYGQPKP
ncbi:MAG: inosine/xanthosine triphosphatase [Gemmataceae bacterium]|nr:inosine/xanthosine triphosphatase [Gemmataceae bacterium]